MVVSIQCITEKGKHMKDDYHLPVITRLEREARRRGD